jgi:4-amino-4-deoxy-L-arabinose transferase-like glycosyltransferase
VGRDARRFRVSLATIVVLGLALRLTYVIVQRDQPPSADGSYYLAAANLLADGKGFINPVSYLIRGISGAAAQHPPAWTVLLAFPSVLGIESQLQHQIFACLVGAATVVVMGFAGRRLAGARAGLIAAAVAALYPYFWLYERALWSETLVLLLVAVAVLLAVEFSEHPRFWSIAALGAVCGLLTLTRAEEILLVPLLLVPLVLLLRATPWRDRLRLLAVGVGATVVVITPWVAYNMSRFDDPVFITTTFGKNLQIANCDSTYHGELLGYFDDRCAPPQLVRRLTPPGGDASTSDAALRRRAVDYIDAHRGRAAVVALVREARAFGLYRPFQQMHLDTRRGNSLWVTRAGFFAYWVLAATAVFGAYVLRRRGRSLLPLLPFVATVVISIAVTFGFTRFRATAEVPIVLLAAVGIDAVLRRSSARSARSASSGTAPAQHRGT